MDNFLYEGAIEKRQSESKLALIGALKETPIIQIACKKAGVGRATYYRWKNEDGSFLKESNEAIKEGIEFINDMSESQVIQLIKEKKMPAIAMWLKNNSARYGASRSIQMPALSAPELTDDEIKLFRKAITLTGTISPYYEKNAQQKRNS